MAAMCGGASCRPEKPDGAQCHHAKRTKGLKRGRWLMSSCTPGKKSIVSTRSCGSRGYVVLLCNRDGVAIHHRGDPARADEFKQWGIWLGGVWSEQIEGTNGIGTCIAEQRPVSRPLRPALPHSAYQTHLCGCTDLRSRRKTGRRAGRFSGHFRRSRAKPNSWPWRQPLPPPVPSKNDSFASSSPTLGLLRLRDVTIAVPRCCWPSMTIRRIVWRRSRCAPCVLREPQ